MYCENCQEEYDDGEFCDCPPPVIKEETITITYDVKIKVHSDSRYCWSIHDSLEDAIKEWNFGSPRERAHYFDQEYCHVAKTDDGKWALLYILGD